MPRRPPHFKVFVTIQNHEKMRRVYGNNDVLALWVRLGIAAVERFADRTGDVFIVHDRELPALTGCGRPDVARTWLSRLADVSPICASREADVWRITFPNFAKKQGFGSTNGAETVPSSSATASATASEEKKKTKNAADAASAAKRSTAPADLGPAEWSRLWGLVWKPSPWLLLEAMEETSAHCSRRWVESQVRETLAYWGGRGTVRADWVKTCANRIFDQDGRRWERLKTAPPIAWVLHAKYPAPSYVPSDVAETCRRDALRREQGVSA